MIDSNHSTVLLPAAATSPQRQTVSTIEDDRYFHLLDILENLVRHLFVLVSTVAHLTSYHELSLKSTQSF